MKRGFTLIELLGVIIVLSFIALIIVPNIMKTVDESEKKTFMISVQSIYKSVFNDATENGGLLNTKYIYKNGILKRGENEVLLSNKLEDGYGAAKIDNDGNITITITDDEYCATNYNKSEIEFIDISNCNSALDGVEYE